MIIMDFIFQIALRVSYSKLLCIGVGDNTDNGIENRKFRARGQETSFFL